MGRVRNLLDTLNLKSAEEISRFLSNALREIQQIINGNISFQDNFRGKILEVVFASADTDVQVQHGLGYTPTGYTVLSSNAAAVVFDGANGKNDQVIFLQSSAVATVNILIF